MGDRGQGFRREWLQPVVLLTTVAAVAFALLYVLDHYVTGGKAAETPGGAFATYVNFDQDHITDAVSSLGSMIAAVLGIVITVVSIVVQLSAERYTGVTTMFFKDRINVSVMAFYVVACVCGVWLSMSVRAAFVPRATVLAVMGTCTIGLVMMAPYFAYVFRFLEPQNIIGRIRRDAIDHARRGMGETDRARRDQLQAQLLSSMEELTDVTSNSISGKDKIIASRAVDALKDLAVEYVQGKRSAHAGWYAIGAGIRDNPDFVAMAPESLGDLEQRRTWVEWKIMRQYLGIYNEALHSMKDINYLVAIDTRYLGEAAIAANDDDLLTLCLWFMNSYLRATLNAKDVRTAYNILNQYRLLIEAMLRAGNGAQAVTAIGHMKYYGHVSFNMSLSFVTETVAYDVCALVELAHELKITEEETLLRMFLDLDRSAEERGQEQALKGVRKAQVKLATYYLTVGEADKARRIREDMEVEPRERLRAIRDELERVDSKDFWEIIDRGRNFEYMPPEQKARMREFFAFLDAERTPRPAMTAE
ncbi:MAG: DUF2254 domain-containing protein [Deltaproteobacteria bacterium]|nr:DUF2254 domain-containing protein [Deltaproteobacteria bacterium]